MSENESESGSYDWLSPVTIVPDRYGGSYSGGRWIAFPCEPWKVPSEPFEDDVPARRWWAAAGGLPVGLESSPDAALLDLMRRLNLIPPRIEHPPRSSGDGWMRTWELLWPNGETTIVDRCWRGRDMGPPD